MNKDRLFKYKVGLGIIGLFVTVMLMVVLAQSGAVKHDKEIYRQADKISTKLNDYTDKHNKVPTTLAQAGVQDAPEDISYIKLSNTRYKFCVTYKNDGNASGAGAQLLDWYYGTSGYNYTSEEDYNSYYLFVDLKHDKGENCQKVDISLYDDYYDNEDPTTDYDTQSL